MTGLGTANIGAFIATLTHPGRDELQLRGRRHLSGRSRRAGLRNSYRAVKGPRQFVLTLKPTVSAPTHLMPGDAAASGQRRWV